MSAVAAFPAAIVWIVGTIVMTLASVYWMAIDYPNWLPDAVLDALPRPALGSAAKWTLIIAGSLVGWAIYQWGTVRKAQRVGPSDRGR